MRKMYSRGYLSLTSLLLCLPVLAGAMSAEQALKVTNKEAVSRGEFIRAAVSVLDIPLKDREELPYKRVAKTLRPYVGAAHTKGALEPVFGTDLRLALPINKGEALQIIFSLQDLRGNGADVRFRDVRQGSLLDKAVRTAVGRGWMEAMGAGVFGVDRVLDKEEALKLLRRVTGQEERPSKTPRSTEEKNGHTIRIRTSRAVQQKTNLPKKEILEAIWQLIQSDYIHADKLDENELGYSAAEAMVKSLGDRYSSFMRPVTAQDFKTRIDGEVTGIGAQVEDRDGVLTIVAPLKGSPADRANLKAGDQILEVNGESLKGLNLNEAVAKVRGPKGSEVALLIRRGGAEFKVSVVRDTVRIAEVTVSWHGKISIVEVAQFGKTTQNELRGLMTRVMDENPTGIVIDLRNNPGGLLDAAEIMVSNFLPKGSTVAQIKSRSKTFDRKTVNEPIVPDNVPLVVLVNGGSASASEIVAGALSDAGRAKIVGTKTFGKGTVQELLQFNDLSSLKITVAEWLTPSGRKIDGIGLTPDIIVQPSDRDEQLRRALDLLRR
jgi:C-terminal peptidase prc